MVSANYCCKILVERLRQDKNINYVIWAIKKSNHGYEHGFVEKFNVQFQLRLDAATSKAKRNGYDQIFLL